MNVIPPELSFPQRTIFREGAAVTLGSECAAFGSKGLIVHGRSLEKSGNKRFILEHWLKAVKVSWYCHESGEPCLEDITKVIKQARRAGAQWISGIGGGSVLDLAKAAAGLCNAVHEPGYYQKGGTLERLGIPFIAVPTTAGTGSEATINAVIINKVQENKVSIRDKRFLARLVILDGRLLLGMPSAVMSYAAMDALVQAYESYISNKAVWLSEVLALKALNLINENITPAYEHQEIHLLSQLLLGSYLAGLGLAISRLGVIHGIAHPLGARYQIPHGLICALCLLSSIEINRRAMGIKYEKLSECVGMDFSRRVESVIRQLNITNPFKDKKLIDRQKIIAATIASGSTAANPKKIDEQDIAYMLQKLF